MAASPVAAGLLATCGAPQQGCHLQLALDLQPQPQFGLRMSSPVLVGLGNSFIPILVDHGHSVPIGQEAVGLLQPCPSLPKAFLQTCRQRAASKNWPKKKLRSQHCLT